jgi:hypothetical protein
MVSHPVVTDIENFQTYLGTFAQISQLSTEGQVTRQRTQKSKDRIHEKTWKKCATYPEIARIALAELYFGDSADLEF